MIFNKREYKLIQNKLYFNRRHQKHINHQSNTITYHIYFKQTLYNVLIEDFLNDPSATNPGLAVDQHLLRDRITEVLRSLTPREREVIELRFGLKDGQPKTLEEVARAYGITRERIRQIEARGLVKLRQPNRSQRLSEFAEMNN